jgi:hypothetical protein
VDEGREEGVQDEEVDPVDESLRITIVPPWYVRHCWKEAAKFLDPATATSRGRHDIASLHAEIERGMQLLWVMFIGDDEMVGAFTTSVFRYPKRSVVAISFLGGEKVFQYREEVIDAVSKYAIEMNCNGIEVVGRRGWLKVLGPSGFEEAFTVLEKDLKNG